MASSSLGPIFAWLGWAFIPGYATSILQSIYYKVTIPVGRTPPQPGQPLFAKHYRRIRILVLSLYLVYTLLQSLYDVKLAGDFFTVLAVIPSTSDREIKSRFRRLAAKHHPDKIQSTASATSHPDGTNGSSDAHFLLLKLAQDTLLNPTMRYAYTRFGPRITSIPALPDNRKPTIQDYVFAGLRYTLVPSYVTNILSLAVLNYFFLPKWGTFWRYYILTLIFTLELYFLTHTDTSFSTLLPSWISTPATTITHLILTRTKVGQIVPTHLLPFQILSVLRSLSISLNIFISQLAPPANSAQARPSTVQDLNRHRVQLLKGLNTTLDHLRAQAGRLDGEATSLLSFQLTPFKSTDIEGTEGSRQQKEELERLKNGIKEGIVMSTLMSQPEVKAAIETAKSKKRDREGTSLRYDGIGGGGRGHG